MTATALLAAGGATAGKRILSLRRSSTSPQTVESWWGVNDDTTLPVTMPYTTDGGQHWSDVSVTALPAGTSFFPNGTRLLNFADDGTLIGLGSLDDTSVNH